MNPESRKTGDALFADPDFDAALPQTLANIDDV